MFNVLKKVVDDWKIVRCYKFLIGNLVEKLIVIIIDNVVNFVKVVEIGGFFFYVCCFVYCLNLVVQEGMDIYFQFFDCWGE